jgi:hypothetical protein
MENLKLFFGAFIQVCAVAANTRVIAHGDLTGMFWTGGLVSWIWWANVKGTRAEGLTPRIAYTIGAACGTVVGGWLGGLLF